MGINIVKNRAVFQDTTKIKLLKSFGIHTLSYSASLFDYYKSKNLQGYVPFYRSTNSSGNDLIVVIGDPVAQKQDYPRIISEFIKQHTSKNQFLIGAQVGFDCAKEFHAHGYHATNMGFELLINIPNFNIKGKKRAKLRSILNTAVNSGVYVNEITVGELNRVELEYVSNMWLQSRINNQELQVLLREPLFEYEADTRIFCAYLRKSIIGFILFEPMYEKGDIFGYYANIIRYLPNAPNGSSDLILKVALECFKEEGKYQLSLGLSPLAELQHAHFEDKITRRLFQITYQFGDRIYPFKNTYNHKRIYFDPDNIQSTKRPVYFFSSRRRHIRDLLDLCQCIGLIPRGTYRSMLYYWAARVAQNAQEQLFNLAKTE